MHGRICEERAPANGASESRSRQNIRETRERTLNIDRFMNSRRLFNGVTGLRGPDVIL